MQQRWAERLLKLVGRAIMSPSSGAGVASARDAAAVPAAPVFRPSADEFRDPMAYIASIRSQAEPHGLARIVPPEGWRPAFAMDRRGFRFRTQKQLVHKLAADSSPLSSSQRGTQQSHSQPKHKASCTGSGLASSLCSSGLWASGASLRRQIAPLAALCKQQPAPCRLCCTISRRPVQRCALRSGGAACKSACEHRFSALLSASSSRRPSAGSCALNRHPAAGAPP